MQHISVRADVYWQASTSTSTITLLLMLGDAAMQSSNSSFLFHYLASKNIIIRRETS